MARRRVLITAGPTREYLDPVRFLSNASTGRQGVALSQEAVRRGWEVAFVHGPLEVPVPVNVEACPVVSAAEMLARCEALHDSCQVLIGAAAVSDYRISSPSPSKHKRDERRWLITLVPTVDVLATLGARKGGRVHVGFALETEDLLEHAADKLHRKRLDWIVGNAPAAIGAERGEFVLVGAQGERLALGVLSKEELARAVWNVIEETIHLPQRKEFR